MDSTAVSRAHSAASDFVRTRQAYEVGALIVSHSNRALALIGQTRLKRKLMARKLAQSSSVALLRSLKQTCLIKLGVLIMYISLLRSKIHRAVVTSIDVSYEGSITVDMDLLDKAGIYLHEKVLIADIENGARFETYVIPGERSTGTIQLNGAAGRLVSIGDHIIIMAFAHVESPPPNNWQPKVITLNEDNTVRIPS